MHLDGRRLRASRRQRPAAALVLLAVLAVAAAGCGNASPTKAASSRASSYRGTPVSGRLTKPAPFALHDQRGRIVSLRGERGRLVLITFLYTHCPDVCPLTADHLNGVLARLGRRRSDVRVDAISVDPRGDTPAAVRRFASAHHLRPQFRYLTGAGPALWKAYDIAVLPHHLDTSVDHSAYALLVDRTGRGRVMYSGVPRTGDVLADVRKLLRSG